MSLAVVSVIQTDARTGPPHWQARTSKVTKLEEDLFNECRKMKEVSHIRAEYHKEGLETRGPTRTSKKDSHSKGQDQPSSLTLPCKQWLLRDRATFNRNKATASAAKPVPEGAKLVSWEVHNTTTPPEAQMRRHRIISKSIKYGRLHRIAAESLVMYNLAARERILARILRSIFEQSLWHDQDNSLFRIYIRNPVRPVDVAAACEVLLRITAEPSPKAGKGELLEAAQEPG